MATAMVMGATGVVGQFLLPRLRARGDALYALSRRDCVAGATQPDVVWLQGNLPAAVPPLPDVDTIYSLGPLDVFSLWFVQAKPHCRQVIALSSMSAETKRESIDAAERELAGRLRDAESALFDAAAARGIGCTVFRPTLIYGTGRDRSLAPIARFARRWRLLPIPRGARGLRQPVHAADLADACVAATGNSLTCGQTYPLGGGERMRFDTLLGRIAAGSPRRALPIPVPLTLLRIAARCVPGHIGAGALSRLTTDLIADNTAAAHDFGYAPRPFVAADVV